MKPLILITNDDSIYSKGIAALVEAARQIGEVVVVAPSTPQSGQGHAITLEHPLRLHPSKLFGDIEAYECSGTPVDCVKLAKQQVLKGRTMDICLSGINHGSNAAINVIYSGTMSAAMEASLEGIPAIGFSLLDYSADANFTAAQHFIHELTPRVLEHHANGTLVGAKLLNVNIPNLPLSEIQGIRFCRQGNARWTEEFVTARDPRGREYFWLTGRFEALNPERDTDIWALEQGYVSVVPTTFDLTDYKALAAWQA